MAETEQPGLIRGAAFPLQEYGSKAMELHAEEG